MLFIKRVTYGAVLTAVFGAAGCGPAQDLSDAETTNRVRQPITFGVYGTTTATPERGTSLPGGSPGIPTVTLPRATAFTTPIVNVPGQSSSRGALDTIGDVGPNHYVQAINGSVKGGDGIFTIYDKAGTPVSPTHTMVPISDLVTTSSVCSTDGIGDAIVNYDQLADRWLILQITVVGLVGNNDICLYVSDTGDPAALDAWTLYHFDLDTLVDTAGDPVPGFFPDYPKLAVWPDAYYVSSNDTSPNMMGAYAIDRAAVLAGTEAQIQRFVIPNLPIPVTFPYQPASVVDLDGSRPPPEGTPGMFLRKVDDESLDPAGNTPTDALEIWELDPDFEDPTNSVLDGPITVVTDDFDVDICSLALFNNCADQPGTSSRLSVLGSLVGALWRVQYRNFGTHETMVGNIVVDYDVEDPAPHWFELRRDIDTSWSLFQEQTFAPDPPDTNDRWMGSIAMDGSGNIALGYSISSSTIFPSINYIGRRDGDPLDMMTTGEGNIFNGTFSASGSSTRWGDYSSMNVDPMDDCTFYYTQMYLASAGGFTRGTQIAAFRFPFPECFPANGACVYATDSIRIADRGVVEPGNQTIGALVSSGSGLTDIGTDTHVGDILSVGDVSLRDRANVTGVVQSEGSVFEHNDVTVSGGISENVDLTLPAPLDLSDVTFPPPSGDVTLLPGESQAIAPGSYGRAAVFSSARLILTAGEYFFTDLQLEPQSVVEVDESAGPVLVFVQSSVIYRGSFEEPGGAVATVFVGYTGSSPVFLEAPFNGTFVAPHASLTLGTSGAQQFRGQFVATRFEMRPEVTLTCDASASVDREPGVPAPSCVDGTKNGSETDIDCGGGACPACPDGDSCLVNADCHSNNCELGVCQANTAALDVSLDIPADWGGGYCATLEVTNTSTVPTTGWNVTLNTNQSTLSTSWNGIFSGSSGVISVAPADWNRVITPGATDTSVGFCADRDVPGSGTLPSVVSATGTF